MSLTHYDNVSSLEISQLNATLIIESGASDQIAVRTTDDHDQSISVTQDDSILKITGGPRNLFVDAVESVISWSFILSLLNLGAVLETFGLLFRPAVRISVPNGTEIKYRESTGSCTINAQGSPIDIQWHSNYHNLKIENSGPCKVEHYGFSTTKIFDVRGDVTVTNHGFGSVIIHKVKSCNQLTIEKIGIGTLELKETIQCEQAKFVNRSQSTLSLSGLACSNKVTMRTCAWGAIESTQRIDTVHAVFIAESTGYSIVTELVCSDNLNIADVGNTSLRCKQLLKAKNITVKSGNIGGLIAKKVVCEEKFTARIEHMGYLNIDEMFARDCLIEHNGRKGLELGGGAISKTLEIRNYWKGSTHFSGRAEYGILVTHRESSGGIQVGHIEDRLSSSTLPQGSGEIIVENW